MTNHDFDQAIVQTQAHRPWPMPDGPWVMTQTWHDLLFAHWPMDPVELRAKVPREFDLDLFNGRAWLGIIPFRMTNVAPRGVPSLPWVSAFPELNVRTYVRVGDRPGIFFFSLDAGSSIAVKAARALTNLPYYRASMTVRAAGSRIEYRSARAPGGRAELVGAYEPVGAPFTAVPGTLEYFLTERYCLYHHDRRRTPYRLEIHHPPWPLQVAEASIEQNTMATASGLHLVGAPHMLHFARRLDVVVWMPSRLDG